MDTETFTIQRDGDSDLRFEGELLAKVSSQRPSTDADADDDGAEGDARNRRHRFTRRVRSAGLAGLDQAEAAIDAGLAQVDKFIDAVGDGRLPWVSKGARWTELALYRTKGGKFVAQQIGRTQREGERDRMKAWVADRAGDVIQYIGHGWLAKKLYAEAGIDDVEHID